MKTQTKKSIIKSDYSERISTLLTPEQTAEYLNISLGTLNKWRSEGRISLPYKKIGNCVRYKLSDVDLFLEQHTFISPDYKFVVEVNRHE